VSCRPAAHPSGQPPRLGDRRHCQHVGCDGAREHESGNGPEPQDGNERPVQQAPELASNVARSDPLPNFRSPSTASSQRPTPIPNPSCGSPHPRRCQTWEANVRVIPLVGAGIDALVRVERPDPNTAWRDHGLVNLVSLHRCVTRGEAIRSVSTTAAAPRRCEPQLPRPSSGRPPCRS
jgi:hypothetical protein